MFLWVNMEDKECKTGEVNAHSFFDIMYFDMALYITLA